MKRSISFRLTWWFSIVFLLGFITLGIAMYFDLAWQLSHGRDRTLSRRAQRCFDLLKSGENQSAARRAAKFDDFADATPEGNLIRVYDERGAIVYGQTPTPAGFPWPSLTPDTGDRYRDVVFEGRSFRILTRNTTLDGHRLTIRSAGQLDDNRQLMARFRGGLEAAAPVVLAVAALCGYFLSRRALQPVDRLISGVRAIGGRDLSGRLPVHPTGDELQRLAETCNDMLARLEDAVSRVNRFTADASHELRGPISFIRTVTEYALQHHQLDAETREAFEDILAESKDAGSLLEDMLALARADEGRLIVELVPLDLSELLGEVCDKVGALAGAKHQMFTTEFGAERPVVVAGDRTALRRLFWALLDNAVKYTPERGRVGVQLEQRGPDVLVSVRDSGIGIPADKLPRVFERFFRGDPSRGRADGTGLGLAIAKWIADAHQAVLSVESEEGRGTTFQIRLRAAQSGAPVSR